MIEPLIYSLNNGQSYEIEFNKTKDHIKFEHYKTVKFLSFDDLLNLKDQIEKIITKLRESKNG